MTGLGEPGICLSPEGAEGKTGIATATPSLTQPKSLYSREKRMQSDTQCEVVVTNVKMPFWSMVTFMIKWSFAAIPAAIILAVIWAIAMGVLGGIFGAF